MPFFLAFSFSFQYLIDNSLVTDSISSRVSIHPHIRVAIPCAFITHLAWCLFHCFLEIAKWSSVLDKSPCLGLLPTQNSLREETFIVEHYLFSYFYAYFILYFSIYTHRHNEEVHAFNLQFTCLIPVMDRCMVRHGELVQP